MAVYKATYCYPFLGSCDTRVAPGEVQWITCKVDSSNKKVTGYRISIYDENNNLIFPYYDAESSDARFREREWNISPVSELMDNGKLSRDDDGSLVMVAEDGVTKIKLPSQEYLTNSGLNGSYLNLPFFQNWKNKIRESANAVYYVPNYFADYVIKPIPEDNAGYRTPDNSDYWIRGNDGNYHYNLEQGSLVMSDELAGTFTAKINGDSKVRPNQTVLLYLSKDSNLDKEHLAENEIIVGHLGYDNSWFIAPDCSTRKDDVNGGGVTHKELDLPCRCLITKGDHHNVTYAAAKNSISEYDGIMWQDIQGHQIKLSVGKSYKWEITLYQGNGEIKSEVSTKMKLVDYTKIDVDEWYDMVLQSGKILGSCPSRIQLAKYNENSGSYLLPRSKDGSSVVLYQTYAQLVNDSGNSMGSRFYVNTYSSSLGHVYPLESESSSITVEGAKEIEFYQHSNNPEAILDTDIVEFAAVKDHVYRKNEDGTNAPAGDVELCGVQNIDDVIGEEGKYVLLMYQKNPAQNGVYKMVSDSDNTITLKTKVTTTTTDEKTGEKKTTTSEVSKIYKRDSGKDEYDSNGIPVRFAWTHELTEDEQKNEAKFILTYYSFARYLRKDNSTDKEPDTKASKVYPEGGGEGVTLSSVKMAVWTRAGGYTSWSDFIGKIIYVKSGTENGQKNFTSTATAGGTLMKKAYDDTTSGSSPLYFVPERPIVLFPQLLNDDYSIKAMGALAAVGTPSNEVDGVLLSEGDYYIDEYGDIWKYRPSESGGSIAVKKLSEIKDVEYYYINQGKTNGLTVCKLNGTVSSDKIEVNSRDLYRAEVLKNTADKTYIGQYSNLDVDMILKFNDRVIRFANGDGPFDYLRINGVDRTVWSISHGKLESPLRSYSNNSDEPYSYKICTFYKKSDENPFYSRETPYLIMNDGLDDGYSKDDDMSILAVYQEDGAASPSSAPLVYSLSKKGIFTGSVSEALRYLSYDEEIQANDEVKEAEETFVFPQLEDSSDGTNPLGIRWKTGDSSYIFHFSKKKIQDNATAEKYVSSVEETYKNMKRKTLGSGKDGLNGLGMPAAMITAAATKYIPVSTQKETFSVFDYSPISETGYKLSLNGLYKQGNGGSWESYRWVLEKVRFDDTLKDSDVISSMIKQNDPSLYGHVSDSIVIKDTGTKYDRRMNASFYGLLDSLDNSDSGKETVGVGGKNFFSNVYMVTLYVTDENGIDLEERRFFEYKVPMFDSFDYCIELFKVATACRDECAELEIKPGFVDSDYESVSNGDSDYLKEFSIFRREYKKLYRYGSNGVKQEKILIGNKWEPVVMNVKAKNRNSDIKILDFNIKSGYSYQYVIFPGSYSEQSKKIAYIYANTGKDGENSKSEYDNRYSWRPYRSALSRPIKLNMQYWSIVNLIPYGENTQPDSDIDTYLADPENIWLFKYQAETGSLTQNISKNEYSTLGRYSKIGVGRKDYLSGSISCYLGSEIIPLSKNGYTERTPASREQPMSTNEKAYMIARWREFVATGTPKLLRNTKGQSWIVQVMDGSTTTNENIAIKPDTISFSWKQIADTEDAVIYADATQAPSNEECLGEWLEDTKYE